MYLLSIQNLNMCVEIFSLLSMFYFFYKSRAKWHKNNSVQLNWYPNLFFCRLLIYY